MESNELISVDQARAIVAANVEPIPFCLQSLETISGLTLAEDIFAPLDLPPFDQSSMDGYAIRYSDISETLIIQGESQAGDTDQLTLMDHRAIRIFTGAPIPLGADTVIVQEKVITESGSINIQDKKIERGSFVRIKGAELKKGELVLKKGIQLSAPVTGLLASMGLTQIPVYPIPAITIIATGKELRKPGELLDFGQVYESNAVFLSAALKQTGISKIELAFVGDDLAMIKRQVAIALPKSEIIILTGGVSVGDYDFVRQALDENGVRCRFHKVKQRPGKPFYFGTINNKIIFGMPGNPGSVITCYYEYVLPAIKHMLQLPPQEEKTAFLKEQYHKVKGLTQFLKGYIDLDIVEILEAQESFRMRSFANANCLVCLDEERIHYEQGETVRVNLLPSYY